LINNTDPKFGAIIFSMKIHIIGGGIIGLCSAWYLAKEGNEVVVVDRSDLSDGASHGNAGMVVPSHFMPLATPGVIGKGIRWMFNKKSPFFIKPRLNMELAQWLWQFYRACAPEKVEKAIPSLKHLNAWSRDLYREFDGLPGFDFHFEEKGLLMLYKDPKVGKEEIEVAERAHDLGMEAQVLSAEAVQQLEPGIKLDVAGGVYYPGDAHLYPNTFIHQLVVQLKGSGVKFITGKAIENFRSVKGRIDQLLMSDDSAIDVENVILAAGSWSAKLLKKAGVKILLQDGKGYSVTYDNPGIKPSIPTILTEAKVAVTPMGNDLRVGGTLEISNFSEKTNKFRLQGVLDSMPAYYPELTSEMPKNEKIWYGYRPCTPDGLPYIGKSNKYENLTIATGHAMMGMSMGPGTGKLVSEIVQKKPLSMNVDLFKVGRF
jgi:D-amino-acid dehydrogenase